MEQMSSQQSNRSGKPNVTELSAAARLSLARWLTTGRQKKSLSLDEVAKVTRIPVRTLEKLEGGDHIGLPADVFVKGFVRSFARAVGLDENDALERFSMCGAGAATMPTATARALIDSMAELAPAAAAQIATASQIVPAEVVEAIPEVALASGSSKFAIADVVQSLRDEGLASSQLDNIDTTHVDSVSLATPKKKRAPRATMSKAANTVDAVASTDASVTPVADVAKRKRTTRATQATQASEGDSTHTTVDVVAVTKTPRARRKTSKKAEGSIDPIASVTFGTSFSEAEAFAGIPVATHFAPVVANESEMSGTSEADPSKDTAAVWVPKMPIAVRSPAVPSIPWHRPANFASTLIPAPTMSIDDADPESAEREAAQRLAQKPSRRSLIPSILLENDDRARQGGLTLAVIILLIAATLTLSYLMRRPGSGGDGMTMKTPVTDVNRSA
jgi:hypothetical protein